MVQQTCLWHWEVGVGRENNKKNYAAKVVLIMLGNYVFVNNAIGGGSPKFFIHTL
jgi:hypothetical protein